MRIWAFALTMSLMPLVAQAGEVVNYSVDGEKFEGYQAKAVGSSKGLVLVIHDWDGLTDYKVKRADADIDPC